jgi:hypothetical protein
MQQNGWITSSKNPRAAARASANRLRKDPAEHVFFGEGQYVYLPPSEELEGGVSFHGDVSRRRVTAGGS